MTGFEDATNELPGVFRQLIDRLLENLKLPLRDIVGFERRRNPAASPLGRLFVHLRGGDGEVAVFGSDLDALLELEAGMLDPATGELHPGVKTRAGCADARA